MKVGACYVHQFTEKIVLAVKVSDRLADAKGGRLFECIVLHDPSGEISAGSVMTLSPHQPYEPWGG